MAAGWVAQGGWLVLDAGGRHPAAGRAVTRDGAALDALADLARQAGQGDARAFRAWVGHVTPPVYRLALRMLGSTSDAEDVVQDTMVRAWQGLGELRDPMASLGWVCSVARHVALDRARSRGRGAMGHAVPLEGDDARAMAERLSDPGADPEQLAHDAGVRAFVRAVMETLPEKYRLVLMLCDVDGVGSAEAAAMLGVPAGTVDSRLHRARAALDKKIRSLTARRGWRFW